MEKINTPILRMKRCVVLLSFIWLEILIKPDTDKMKSVKSTSVIKSHNWKSALWCRPPCKL